MVRPAPPTSCASNVSSSSPSGDPLDLDCVHDLANFKARLKALEARVAEDGIILTEAQFQGLEKKNRDDEACGEVETAHPGYLGSQEHLLCRHPEGCGAARPAKLCRYLFQGRAGQALHHQDADHSTTTCSMTGCCSSMTSATCLCCGS